MKFFIIKVKEKRPIYILFLMFFCIISFSITAAAVRDAVFLINFDKNFLPLMYVLIALVMALTISIYKKYTKSIDQLFLCTILAIIFSLTLVFFHFFLQGYMIPIFYIWIEIITILSILQFWILAGEVFNTREAKIVFPIIISGGSFAAIIAGSSIKPFVNLFGSKYLIFLSIFFLLLSAFIGLYIKPYRINSKKIVNIAKEKTNLKSLKLDPYVISIALLVACSAFLSKTIDYQFKIMATSIYPIQDQLVNFFGNYYLWTGLATLIMQFFITGTILKNLGILIGLLILPLSLLIGSIGFLFSTSFIAIYITKFSDQVFKFSIHSSIREILWLPLAPKKRIESKPIIDGTIRALIEGFSGLLIFFLATFNIIGESDLQILSVIAILVIIFYVWISIKIKDGYINSIMKSIENRRLNLDDIEHDISDANTVSTINLALNDKDDLKKLFAIDLLWDLPLYPWKNTLQSLFTSQSSAVRRGILELTWNKSKIIPDDLVIGQIKKEDDVSPYAIICAHDRKVKNINLQIESFLEHKNKPIQIASSVVILTHDNSNHLALSIIKNIIDNEKVSEVLFFISLIKSSPNLIDKKITTKFLSSESKEIKNAILIHLKHNPWIQYLDDIIFLLNDPVTKLNAQEAILALGDIDVREKLYDMVTDKTQDLQTRKSILEIIHHFDSENIIDIMLLNMNDPELLILKEVSTGLIKISKIRSFQKIELLKIDKEIQLLAKRAFQLHIFYETLHPNKTSDLIKDHIKNDLSTIIPILLRLGTLREPKVPIETYIRYIESNDPDLMPLVIELVESTFSPIAGRLTIPLIDKEINPLKVANDLFKENFLSEDEMLIFWINNSHYWKTLIAIHYCILNEHIHLLKQIDWSGIPIDFFKNNIFTKSEQEYLNRNFFDNKIADQKKLVMYSVLEKTILLKSVSLFQNIPGNILSKIAQISTEIQLSENDLIFKEGTVGDSLYIIISGNVNIVKDGQLITNLSKGDCLGEMALLDREPRSADAVATNETILLKIDQEGFYELMAGNSEIMREIVKMLAKRLRSMNKEITKH